MAKKKKTNITTVGYSAPGVYTTPITGVPITLNGTSYSSWTIGASAGTLYSLASGILDLRSHLFKVDIGDYDASLVTALLRGVEFENEKLIVSFLLDDKDTIREAFNEYHYFRLSYLDTKGKEVETYEIKTDPIAETKYILPNVRHDLSDILNWKLVWSPYNITKI